MTLWELLATTESHVISWQDLTEPWPAESRIMHWQNGQGQHQASAVFDHEWQVLALEVLAPLNLRWICQAHSTAWQQQAQQLAVADPMRAVSQSAALRAFLESVR